MLVFGLFGLTVELSQYRFGLGISEIDDVLHITRVPLCVLPLSVWMWVTSRIY